MTRFAPSDLPWHIVRVFVVLVKIVAVALQRRLDATAGRVFVLRLAVVPYRVLVGEGDLLTGTFDPVAGRGDQIVRKILAKLV